MDSFGQMGPSKPHYDEDVEQVAVMLSEGSTVRVKFADQGTTYPLVLSRRVRSAYDEGADTRLFVASTTGAAFLDAEDIDWPTIADRLNYELQADAVNVAGFLAGVADAGKRL